MKNAGFLGSSPPTLITPLSPTPTTVHPLLSYPYHLTTLHPLLPNPQPPPPSTFSISPYYLTHHPTPPLPSTRCYSTPTPTTLYPLYNLTSTTLTTLHPLHSTLLESKCKRTLPYDIISPYQSQTSQ